jgi:hypothetical protein
MAYAKIIKGRAEGEEVTVGSGAIVTVRLEVFIAGMEQVDTNTASRQSRGMMRCISFHG